MSKSIQHSLEERFQASGGRGNYVRKLFGRIAGFYDLMNRLMSMGLDAIWRKRAVRHLALSTGETALDLGTGTADMAITIAQNSRETTVIGMDITPEMLEVGRDKIRKLGLGDRITLTIGDAEKIDLPDNSVDGCISGFTVRNFTNLRQGFREMLRVVRPGGRVVCLEITHPPGKIWGALFYIYFFKLAPLFGTLLGKAPEEYNYLPQSLTIFPGAPELKLLMEEEGWSDVRYHYQHGGLVAIHVGTKPQPE